MERFMGRYSAGRFIKVRGMVNEFGHELLLRLCEEQSDEAIL